MSLASRIISEELLEDFTNKSLFCICCMGQSGTFIRLASCAHKEYLESFPISDLNPEIPKVVCSKCHDILKTVTLFKEQVWNSLNILLEKVNHLEKIESTKSNLEISETLHCNIERIDQVDNTEHLSDNSRKFKNISTALGIINSNAASMSALTSSQNFIGLTETLLQATTLGFNLPLMRETVLRKLRTNNLADSSTATSTVKLREDNSDYVLPVDINQDLHKSNNIPEKNKMKTVNKTKNETILEMVHENINRVRDNNGANAVEFINVNESHILPVDKDKYRETGNANTVSQVDNNELSDRHNIISENIEMEIEVIKNEPDLDIVQEKLRKPVKNREAVIAIHFEDKTKPINIKTESEPKDPLSTKNENHLPEIFVKPEFNVEISDVGIVGTYGTAVLPDTIKFEPEDQEEVEDSYMDSDTATEADKNSHKDVKVRAAIVLLHKQNVSISEIGRRLNISRKTVQRWVRRYAKSGVVDRLRPGPKSNIYTDASQLHKDVVAAHATNPFASTRTTAAAHGVTLQTVRNHLRAAGMQCLRLKKDVSISEVQRKNRLNFARQYIDFDWFNNVVIFSHEKCFKSDKDGRKILWRKAGGRLGKTIVLKNRSIDDIDLEYCGWMSTMGPGELVEVGLYSCNDYLDILKEVMLPTMRIAYPNEHIYFVHGNTTVHRARMVHDWLNEQENLTVINWPSKSFDLNPVEDLWRQMVRNFDLSNVRSKYDFEAVVDKTWDSFRGMALCSDLIASMPQRLQEVINNEGAPPQSL